MIETEEPDVHVDWHMTPDEWRQLRQVLREHLECDYPSLYISRLSQEGKLQ
jgi:hypothetical protein